MSATRLLLLGTVRIFQPVHGYFVRRELLSWHADAWANLNPGSVYNGLRSLAKDGFVKEVGTEAEGGRPARTTFRLTVDGQTEFLRLLRNSLWNVSLESADLMAAWSFAWALKREEVIAALESRIEQVEASARRLLERLRAGEYWFEGEPDPPWSTPAPGGARTLHGPDG